MPIITTKVESKRGCGYRQPGGLYLISDGISSTCGKLPVELCVCPTCGNGITHFRGFKWVTYKIIEEAPCDVPKCKGCFPFNGLVQEFGLMWVGEKFYPTPYDFIKEATSQGISKRIKSIPNKFKINMDWILLAHMKAVEQENGEAKPGIFRAFKPTRVEYIVKGDETEEELNNKEKRGITLVKVVRDIDLQQEVEL